MVTPLRDADNTPGGTSSLPTMVVQAWHDELSSMRTSYLVSLMAMGAIEDLVLGSFGWSLDGMGRPRLATWPSRTVTRTCGCSISVSRVFSLLCGTRGT